MLFTCSPSESNFRDGAVFDCNNSNALFVSPFGPARLGQKWDEKTVGARPTQFGCDRCPNGPRLISPDRCAVRLRQLPVALGNAFCDPKLSSSAILRSRSRHITTR